MELRHLLLKTFRLPEEKETPNLRTNAQFHQKLADDKLTCSEILLDDVNGATLRGRMKQKQEDGLQDAEHVIEGQRSNQPALSCSTDGAISRAQAVHHNTQGPDEDIALSINLQVCIFPSHMITS